MPEVVIAGGESAGGLSTMLGTLLAQNIEQRPEKLRDFRALDCDVLMEVSDLGESVTLSFSGDRCTVHDGDTGHPVVRIRTDSETLMGLSNVRIGPLGLPNYLDPQGRAVLRAMAGGRLRIRGMRHLAVLNRVTRLFSVT